MNEREPYEIDLSDAEWHLLEPLMPPRAKEARLRTRELRELINAILYKLKTGCHWRMLPHNLPHARLSSTTMLYGAMLVPSSVFTTNCAVECALRPGAIVNQAWVSLIVKRSKPPKKGATWLRWWQEDKGS